MFVALLGLSGFASADVTWSVETGVGSGYSYYGNYYYGYCGDGVCGPGEGYWNCPADCGGGYYSSYSYYSYGPDYYWYYPYPYYYYVYPYYYPSTQAIAPVDNYCSDGTPKGECVRANGSITGMLCSDRGIVKGASICGCPTGYVVNGNDCVNTCTDGTIIGDCSENQPFGCDTDGVLRQHSVECGCPEGFAENGKGGCVAVKPACYIDVTPTNQEIRALHNVTVAVNYFDYASPLQSVVVACGDGQVVSAGCGAPQNVGSNYSPVYQGTCIAVCKYGPEQAYPSKHLIKAYAAGKLCGTSKVQVIPPEPTTGSLLVQVSDCDTGEAISGARVQLNAVPIPVPTPVPVTANYSVELKPGAGGKDASIGVRTERTSGVLHIQPDAASGADTFIDSGNVSSHSALNPLEVGYDESPRDINFTNKIVFVGQNLTTGAGTTVLLASITSVGQGPGQLPQASFYVYSSAGSLLTIQTMQAGQTYSGNGFTLAVNTVFPGINSVNYADVNFSYPDNVKAVKRALLSFNLSQVPAGATIDYAVLKVYSISGGAPLNVSAHQVTSNWTEDATWSMRTPSLNWGTAGGDYSATLEASVMVADAGTYEINLTQLARNWVSGTQNYGVLLKAFNESVENIKNVYSSDGANVSIAPELEVSYSITRTTEAGANYGNSQALRVGLDSASNSLYRSLLYFDLSSIPSNAVMNSSELVLYSDGNGPAMSVSLHEVSRNWTEGDGTAGSGATWLSYNGSANWSNPGGDYNAVSEAARNVSSAGDYSWNTTTLVSRLVLGASNSGFMLVADNESQGMKVFSSGDAADAQQPRLRITYAVTTYMAQNATNVTSANAAQQYSATVYTDSNGEVLFDYLNPLTHAITVSKGGYPDAGSSKLVVVGTVVPAEVCLSRVACDVSAKLVGTAKDLIQVKVINNLASSNAVTVDYSGAIELDGPANLTLGPGEQRIISVIPRPPANYVGGSKALVSVAGNGTCRANLEIPVIVKGGLSLWALDSEKDGLGGTTTCFKLLVRNTGPDKGSVTMASPSNYSAFFTTLSPKQFRISPRESRYVDFCVKPSAGEEGSQAFNVSALSPINDASVSVMLNLPGGDAFATDFANCPEIQSSATPVYYPVSVENNMGPGDFIAGLEGAGDGVSIAQPRIYNLGQDDVRKVYLVFDTGALIAGEHYFDLIVRKDGRVVYQLPLCFTHGARKGVEIDLAPAAIIVPRGSGQSALLSVRNSGNVRATYSVKTPSSFSSVTITPGTLTIEPGEEAQADVYVNPSQMASPGSYDIPIQLYSDGKVLANRSLAVKVVAELLFHSAVSSPVVGVYDEDGAAKATVEFTVANNEANQVTVNAALNGLPADWAVSVDSRDAVLAPGESRKFVFAVSAEAPEARDYPATIQLSTSDGKKAFVPVNIPMANYAGGRLSGFFTFGSSETLILVFLIVLAAAGAYLYVMGRDEGAAEGSESVSDVVRKIRERQSA